MSLSLKITSGTVSPSHQLSSKAVLTGWFGILSTGADVITVADQSGNVLSDSSFHHFINFNRLAHYSNFLTSGSLFLPFIYTYLLA